MRRPRAETRAMTCARPTRQIGNLDAAGGSEQAVSGGDSRMVQRRSCCGFMDPSMGRATPRSLPQGAPGRRSAPATASRPGVSRGLGETGEPQAMTAIAMRE
jgi:hypothetical protein